MEPRHCRDTAETSLSFSSLSDEGIARALPRAGIRLVLNLDHSSQRSQDGSHVIANFICICLYLPDGVLVFDSAFAHNCRRIKPQDLPISALRPHKALALSLWSAYAPISAKLTMRAPCEEFKASECRYHTHAVFIREIPESNLVTTVLHENDLSSFLNGPHFQAPCVNVSSASKHFVSPHQSFVTISFISVSGEVSSPVQEH